MILVQRVRQEIQVPKESGAGQVQLVLMEQLDKKYVCWCEGGMKERGREGCRKGGRDGEGDVGREGGSGRWREKKEEWKETLILQLVEMYHVFCDALAQYHRVQKVAEVTLVLVVFLDGE